MSVKNSIVVDAHWHNLDVVFKFPHVLKGLEQNLDRLVRLLWGSNLSTPDPLIILVDRGYRIIL
jgi:hypothetical protein